MAKHPPPPPGAERREHPRQDVFAQVEVHRGDAILILAVINLSLGGAFFELPEPGMIVKGDQLIVHLAVNDRDVAQPARVVRVIAGPPAGFAVAWVGRKPETVAVVSSLMRAA